MASYPYESFKANETGTGRIKVTTDGSGRVKTAAMSKSTGVPRLDQNTINYATTFWEGPPNSTRVVEVVYNIAKPGAKR